MPKSLNVSIHKAQGIGERIANDAHITITEEFPDCEDSCGIALHRAGAASIELVLWSTLPGGTYDRLFAKMVQRKASSLRVSYGELEKRDA